MRTGIELGRGGEKITIRQRKSDEKKKKKGKISNRRMEEWERKKGKRNGKPSRRLGINGGDYYLFHCPANDWRQTFYGNNEANNICKAKESLFIGWRHPNIIPSIPYLTGKTPSYNQGIESDNRIPLLDNLRYLLKWNNSLFVNVFCLFPNSNLCKIFKYIYFFLYKNKKDTLKFFVIEKFSFLSKKRR